MSLVNDMLKDLDRRKRLVAGAVPSVFIDGQDSGQGNIKSWKVIILITAGILVGVGGGFFYFQGSQQSAIDRDLAVNVQQGGNVGNTGINPEAGSPASNNQSGSAQISSGDQGISIFADNNSAGGFVLRVVSIYDFGFDIVSRDDYGIEVLLPGIRTISHNEANIAGLNVSNTDTGVKLGISKKDRFEFLVYEESSVSNDVGKTLIIEGLIKEKVQIDNSNLFSDTEQPAETESSINSVSDNSISESIQENEVVDKAPVKTARVLSLEERDINLSKKAASLIQHGQIIDAYAQLLRFIEENAEAHRSRETLATLLFAQQEYQQADVIIDQGLQLAPNYSAYKKIKARLLMMNRDSGTAANFLSVNPPALTADPEYFELLASAYQQNMQHRNAIETYQNLIRHDSQQARWWVGMGVSLEASGEVDDALSSYQAALQNPELDAALRQYSQNRIKFLRN